MHAAAGGQCPAVVFNEEVRMQVCGAYRAFCQRINSRLATGTRTEHVAL